MQLKRVIVGITGASGIIYGIKALEMLSKMPNIEIHLIMSPSAKRTLSEETDISPKYIESLANVVHSFHDIGASISSGSFKTAGMLVAPCSIKSMSAIANSYDDNLITRAADVCLKERRPLVLMIRETPLHLGHLETMTKLASYGAIIAPPVPAFYTRPNDLNDIVEHSVGRALDLINIDHDLIKRWGE